MDPKRVAELYILYLIDALDAATAKRFMSKLKEMKAQYASIEEFMQEYEAEESIYVDLIEWVKDEWANTQEANPKMSATQFAKSKVSDFLSSLT